MTSQPSTDDSEFDSQLAEFLEQQCEAVQRGESIEIPENLLKKYPDLRDMIDCLSDLDSLAVAPVADFAETITPASSSNSGGSSLRPLPRDFGSYVLEEELGRGGMGVVYKARHQTLDSHFALKMIRASEFASEEEVRRFFGEARAASRLRHSNIVSVHDAGEQDGIPFLVMTYISDHTLADRIRDEKRPIETSIAWLVQIARAVAYLHRQDIIHRDLKPSNVLVDNEGVAYVTDFGLAKVFDLDGDHTLSGTILGTPAYMAPEQAWGKPKDLTAQCDIYSLGAILYELLTGRPPFSESKPLDQMLRLRDAEPRRLQALNPAIPIELEMICLRCLEKKPKDRYQSADDLADDLERFLNEEPITMPTFGAWDTIWRWSRREPALVVHLSAFLVIFLILFVAELRYELSHDGMRDSYLPVVIILAVWSGVSVLFQKLLVRDVKYVRRSWVATDAALFTASVTYAEGPIESLIVGYALLIVASSMWYKPRLVAVTTGASILSYLTLNWFRGDPDTPSHYPYLVVGILGVLGAIVTSLVRRILQLLSARTRN